MASPSPAPSTSPLNPAELQGLVARAGLELNPGQLADLVLVWRQMAGLLALLPRDRPFRDDQAYAFRLAPPAAQSAARPAKARPAKAQPAKAKPSKPKAAPRKAATPSPRAGARARARR